MKIVQLHQSTELELKSLLVVLSHRDQLPLHFLENTGTDLVNILGRPPVKGVSDEGVDSGS